MPSALRELQTAFAAHIVGADQGNLIAAVISDTIASAARLNVYRHHVFESLGTALAATFPTVQALVGADFFRVLARAFIGQNLPEQPVLSEYGAGFAAFIAGYAPAAGLPYLADAARLDWALNLAFHAPTGGRLQASDLASLASDQLPALCPRLAPGAFLVRSAYPLDRIWQASQPEGAEGTVDLESGGADLLVLRRIDDSAFVSLAAGEAAFVGCLDGATSLEAASTAAFHCDPAFDLSACFARLLGLEAFAALQ
jgi:hypothetical protein